MLDDLRDSISTPEEEPPKSPVPARPAREKGNFLGMTAKQRFVIALLLLLMVCVLGAFALLAFEKVVPPIY